MALPANKLITINDRGARAATTFGSLSAGGANMVFIKKLTASSSATLSFVDGADSVVLDSTYKEYVFTFNNIHPANDNVAFKFQGSTDTGSSYGINITSTAFYGLNQEDDSGTALSYNTAGDLAQSTSYQQIIDTTGNANDESGSGTLTLYNPSSTTFVKHFTCTSSFNYRIGVPGEVSSHIAGYFNTTSAVDAVQFKMESGNVDAGTICLYGIA